MSGASETILPVQVELAENLHPFQLIISEKLNLLKELESFLLHFSAVSITEKETLALESRTLANKIAELFPRDDEFSYRSSKQLLFDDVFGIANNEYPLVSETQKRIAELTTSLIELQQKVTLALEHSFSLGQLVCDSNHNLFMVIGIVFKPKLETVTLKLIAQDGKEISGSAADYSLSEDPASIPSFIDQVAHQWKAYGGYATRQTWIDRAETPYREAKKTWSLLNTAVRKSFDFVR